MSWSRLEVHKNLPFGVTSDLPGYPPGEVDGEIVGFLVRDAETIQAIRARDERIFDILNLMVDDIEEYSLVMWAGDHLSYYHWQNEKTPDEYEALLERIYSSRFADERTTDYVHRELERLEAERQLHVQNAAKKMHSARRRSQFARNYDQLMLQLIERDGYKCVVCGTIDDLTIDHIIPLSKGGGDEIGNLHIMCRTHNSFKGDKIGSENS